MSSQSVFVEGTISGTDIVALLARVRLFTRVGSHVASERTTLGEGPAADGADIGLFAGMSSDMSSEVSFLLKSILATRFSTDIRFFAGMTSHVSGEMTFLSAGVVTSLHGTGIRLIASMGT